MDPEGLRRETEESRARALVALEETGTPALLGIDLVGGDALLLLGVAVGDAAVGLTAVDCVGALVLLHVAGPLGRRAQVLERRPVHLEGPLRRRADDRDGRRADRAWVRDLASANPRVV